ncbi:hypothetical protein L596_018001 [Steinernema carpocapsae]|uniref:Uncharacterized protein n=1 Tax=Steinernema carpocapsae TaxID=34508 RepID=A0A4U5N3C6_STECR|nr:hypothetical protein L596_018001 [Steinernema carpocapsae]
MASYTYIFKLSFATDDFTEERRTFTFQSQSINGFEWYIYVDKDREVDSKFNYGGYLTCSRFENNKATVYASSETVNHD